MHHFCQSLLEKAEAATDGHIWPHTAAVLLLNELASLLGNQASAGRWAPHYGGGAEVPASLGIPVKAKFQ